MNNKLFFKKCIIFSFFISIYAPRSYASEQESLAQETFQQETFQQETFQQESLAQDTFQQETFQQESQNANDQSMMQVALTEQLLTSNNKDGTSYANSKLSPLNLPNNPKLVAPQPILPDETLSPLNLPNNPKLVAPQPILPDETNTNRNIKAFSSEQNNCNDLSTLTPRQILYKLIIITYAQQKELLSAITPAQLINIMKIATYAQQITLFKIVLSHKMTELIIAIPVFLIKDVINTILEDDVNEYLDLLSPENLKTAINMLSPNLLKRSLLNLPKDKMVKRLKILSTKKLYIVLKHSSPEAAHHILFSLPKDYLVDLINNAKYNLLHIILQVLEPDHKINIFNNFLTPQNRINIINNEDHTIFKLMLKILPPEQKISIVNHLTPQNITSLLTQLPHNNMIPIMELLSKDRLAELFLLFQKSHSEKITDPSYKTILNTIFNAEKCAHALNNLPLSKLNDSLKVLYNLMPSDQFTEKINHLPDQKIVALINITPIDQYLTIIQNLHNYKKNKVIQILTHLSDQALIEIIKKATPTHKFINAIQGFSNKQLKIITDIATPNLTKQILSILSMTKLTSVIQYTQEHSQLRKKVLTLDSQTTIQLLNNLEDDIHIKKIIKIIPENVFQSMIPQLTQKPLCLALNTPSQPSNTYNQRQYNNHNQSPLQYNQIPLQYSPITTTNYNTTITNMITPNMITPNMITPNIITHNMITHNTVIPIYGYPY